MQKPVFANSRTPRRQITNFRAQLSGALLLVALLAAAVPWDWRITVPAVLASTSEVGVYPVTPAKLTRIYVKEGVDQ